MTDILDERTRAELHALLDTLPRRTPFHGAQGVRQAVDEIEQLLAHHVAPPSDSPEVHVARRVDHAAFERLASETSRFVQHLAQLPDGARARMTESDPGAPTRLEAIDGLAVWLVEEAEAHMSALVEAQGEPQPISPLEAAESLIEALDGLWRRLSEAPMRRDRGAAEPYARLIATCAGSVNLTEADAHRIRVRVFDRTELSESAALLAMIPDLE
jgi:hypothetical protein